MKEILEVVVKNLVDNPNDVSVKESAREKSTCYEIRVAKDDMGKVIGRQGRMAKAIRTIVKAIAIKEHKRIDIEFVDN